MSWRRHYDIQAKGRKMKSHLVVLGILIMLAIGGISYRIYTESIQDENIVPLFTPSEASFSGATLEERQVPPNPKLLLDSLAYFQSQKEEPVPALKKSWGLSLNLLYSPFSSRIGFNSMVSFNGLSLGVTYADDFYITAGYTFSF